MNLIRMCIARPVGVTVGVFLLVMAGLIGLGQIPVQLIPTVDRPIVQVNTIWPGRSPQEIVNEITKEQESYLKNVTGVKRMRSTSSQGQSEITLEFYLGTNIDVARQEVSDALRQVPDYPDDVDEPVIVASDGEPMQAIAWMILDVDPDADKLFPGFDVASLNDRVVREIRPYLERIDGVARVNVYGGREREAQVLVDMTSLALRGVSPTDLSQALQRANRNLSAGTIDEGKRSYRVRVTGQFTEPDQILRTVIAYREGKPVLLGDVATVQIGHEKISGFVRSLGRPCMAINVIRKAGSNVVDIMEDLRVELDKVRADLLPKLDPAVGPHLRLRQVYDETEYITAAISLVTDNVWIGGLLAAAVLLLFLRSFLATGIIALAIPVSVIGTFLVLLLTGRSLNVVSLAGLAFAVGMVVDNAIVVLENIDRHRAMGKPAAKAALDGTTEVWGAILASTLTTIAVFIPVLTIQEESGQLFRDIALAIAAAVALSLIVSITVVPAAAAMMPDRAHKPGPFSRALRSLGGFTRVASWVAHASGEVIYWLISGWRRWSVRPAIIVGLAIASVLVAVRIMPPMDYLPAGNRNLVFGGLLIPPGTNVAEMERMAETIEAQIEPYMRADINDPASMATLPPIAQPFTFPPQFYSKPAAVENFFIGGFGGFMFCGATSQDDQVVKPVGSLLSQAMMSISGDVFGGANQSSLFARGGDAASVIVQISGPDLAEVQRAAQAMYMTSGMRYGFGVRVRATPANFNLAQPETRIEVSDTGSRLGLANSDIGTAVRALFDGLFLGDYLLDGEPIDLKVLPAGGRLEHLEQFAAIPIATPTGAVVPLDQLVSVVRTTAAQDIYRTEELPTVEISIEPEETQTIEQLIADVRENVIAPAEASGLITGAMRVRLEGTAEQLQEIRASLLGGTNEGFDPKTIALGRTAGRVSLAIAALGTLAIGVLSFIRRHTTSTRITAVLAAAFLGAIVVGAISLFGTQPQLAMARLVWALLVVYLLLCALYESFLYPLVIMFSVPFAFVGGFLGLSIVHNASLADPTKSPINMDVVTMLGFIILMGTVVNAAILLVEVALADARQDGRLVDNVAQRDRAIAHAVKLRLRPISMTVCTTLGGMLPLVLAPGSGSEMYRGLGAVVLGGLVCSTAFTLLVVPLTLSVAFDFQAALRAVIRAVNPAATSGSTASPALSSVR